MDLEPIEGEVIQPVGEEEVSPAGHRRIPVVHPYDDTLTCYYYPESDFYRSDGSDGKKPGWIVKAPMHPEFQNQMFRTTDDARRALQQGRDKKREAMERGVRAAVAEKQELALDDIKDEDAIEYATKILTHEIVLNPKAPARERWQFFTKMLELAGVVDASQIKGNTVAIQVNVDPSIGQRFR